MIHDHLMEAIRQDADLLTKSDAWLEEEKNYFTEQMRKSIEELKPILLAIAIKQKLLVTRLPYQLAQQATNEMALRL